MQRMLTAFTITSLMGEVNEFLRDGWKIVPGTIGGIDRRLSHSTTGVVEYEATFWAVVQKDEPEDVTE